MHNWGSSLHLLLHRPPSIIVIGARGARRAAELLPPSGVSSDSRQTATRPPKEGSRCPQHLPTPVGLLFILGPSLAKTARDGLRRALWPRRRAALAGSASRLHPRHEVVRTAAARTVPAPANTLTPACPPSSGGLSVDAMLKCRCSAANTPCAFLREDGALTGSPIARQNTSSDLLALFKRSKLFGSPSCGGGDACSAAASPAGQRRLELLVEGSNAPCRAQVLATHAPMRWVQSRPLWSRAAYVAVLREPVARVWSFYLCAWPPPSIPAPSARSHARAHARAPRPLLAAADIRRKSRRFQEFSLPRVLHAHRLAQRA
jgi:hypothetical protein